MINTRLGGQRHSALWIGSVTTARYRGVHAHAILRLGIGLAPR